MDAEALFLLKHHRLVKLETRIPADLACHWNERLDAALLERPMCSGVRCCAGFRTPASQAYPRGVTTGVRKAPRHEIAGRGTDWAVPRAQLWGFGRVRATAEVGSEAG